MPFPANTIAYNSGNSAGIYSLKVAGDSVYGTGWNFDASAPIFESVFSADATTGQLRYVSGCIGDTYDTLPVAGVLYAVSHNHNCTPLGGWREQGGLARRAFAFRLDPVPGKVNGPGGYGSFQGQPAPELLHWYPDLTTGHLHRAEPGRLEPRRQRHLHRLGRRVPDRERRRPAGPGPLRGAGQRTQHRRPPRLRHADPEPEPRRRTACRPPSPPPSTGTTPA